MLDGVPYLSVITVVFNWGKTIQKTIESVLSQNNQNCEYIIVDAMSTDETEEIIRSYSGITYVREPDRGLYDAMNKWIKLARGEVIGIINADDFYLPGTFAEVMKEFTRTQSTDIIHGNIIDCEKNWSYFESRPYSVNLLRYWMCIKHPTCFVKRKVYDKIGAFDTSYQIAADYDFVLRAYMKGYHFHHLDRATVFFRRDGISDKRRFLASCEQLKVQKNNRCGNSIISFFVFIYWVLVKPLYRYIKSLLFNFRYWRKL